MTKITVLKDTYFKTSTDQSLNLEKDKKTFVKSSMTFEIEQINNHIANHISFTLKEPLNKRKTWFAYKPHIQIEHMEDRLPESVNLVVPWFSQRDNMYHPHGTCNITSVAMCLAYYGINTNSNLQLEDQLFKNLGEMGLDRHYHSSLRFLFNKYGINDIFKMDATWDEVKNHIASGNPVIYSGKLTASGHIIVLRGYDRSGFYVNDPYGEYFNTGYKDLSGDNLHYSYNLLKSKSMTGRIDTTWAHFPEPKV